MHYGQSCIRAGISQLYQSGVPVLHGVAFYILIQERSNTTVEDQDWFAGVLTLLY